MEQERYKVGQVGPDLGLKLNRNRILLDNAIAALEASAILLAVSSTGNIRTQAYYNFPFVAPYDIAMSSELDLSITIPSGATKNLLRWDIYGEQVNSSCVGFILYRNVDGGAFTKVAASQNATADYWSGITRPYATLSYGYASGTTSISLEDETLPSEGSVVTYRIYANNIRNDAGGGFYLNRPASSAGASLYMAGSSCGTLMCI